MSVLAWKKGASGYIRRMVGIGLESNRIWDSTESGVASLPAVDDEDLAIRHEEELGHDACFEHLLDLPPFFDAFGSNREATALIGGRILGRQVGRLDESVSGGSTTDEHFWGIQRRREREQSRRAIEWVRDSDTIWNVGQDSLSFRLNIVYDRLVARYHQHFAIWKSENTNVRVNFARRLRFLINSPRE